MSAAGPLPQADRDRLADIGLTDLDDHTGTGGSAEHHDELVAS
ncbi:hypothetical protein [Mycolicibacterium fortuitum]|nr:hypothetical protein [Mycolicibacterium fortuitum]